MANWLLKTEPTDYSYSDLERELRARWDGVRGTQALRHIRQIRAGDLAFIYHTGKEKAIVGVAEVLTDPYPDPNSADVRLLVFDVQPRSRLNQPVSLREVKSWPQVAKWALVRQPRLSVMPVPETAWQMVMAAGRSSPSLQPVK